MVSEVYFRVRCYYEDGFKVFKLGGKLHEKIVLFNIYFKNHIKDRHPETNIEKIQEILENPDYVYKQSRNSSCYFYEKSFGEDNYRVVIDTYKKHVKKVITAYKIDSEDEFTVKHVYCVYDKDTFIEHEDIEREFENDREYYYKLFNIAE